jgi:DHA2 family multidrug resistance protein-like MFS transporter
VALLGSLLTAVYSTTVQLPDGTPQAARESLGTAVSLAGQGNQPLVDAASTAFDTGYVIVMAIVAVVLAIGVGITGALLRRRDTRFLASSSATH